MAGNQAVQRFLQGGSASGHPLEPATREQLEPRFGRGFSRVRVHTDAEAAMAARSVEARAFTLGSQIVFGAGEYSPATTEGQRLLAHELMHVAQQEGVTGPAVSLQRTVAPTSNCPPNVHNAPADPLAALTRVDELAQALAGQASGLLLLESISFNDPVFGRSSVFDAYAAWFGTPQQTAAGTWRSRFRGAPFATEDEAIAHEMRVLSDRFGQIQTWLAGNVRYRCAGPGAFAIPGCRSEPCGSSAARTCPTGSRTVRICPPFWVLAAPQDKNQAALLIHEALHPLLHSRRHPTATVPGRARNPGCYEAFVHEVNSTGLAPAECTRL
jgi:hypothetical protein